ncbi:MAG: amino acid permease [Saprospiraceae bacterium]
MTPEDQKIGWRTAMWLVMACMIGTGVFTSLGFQLVEVKNTYAIVLLWILGGVFALIGAFTYAELGTHFKESGGDYIFLSRIFHPFVGYIYAWTSLCVGFSAPIAIAAMAMTKYLKPIHPTLFNEWFGIGIIILLTLLHSISIKRSGQLQDVTTYIKVVFVLALIIIGYYVAPMVDNAILLDSSWKSEILIPGFAVSLIYVTYAYTGWNSAAYIIDEIQDPRKNLPKALIIGTVLVTVTYILLHLVLLRHASVDQLAGQIEVATISFSNIFGNQGAIWIGIFIGIQLIATISGYLWIGSRIIYAMADEHPLWTKLVYKNKLGIPTRTLWIQACIAIVLTLTGSFEQVLLYAGFVLQLMGTLTIGSLLWVKRKKGTFTSPFRPFLQIIYIMFSLWVLGFMLYDKPYESMIGLGIVAVGAVTYFIRP